MDIDDRIDAELRDLLESAAARVPPGPDPDSVLMAIRTRRPGSGRTTGLRVAAAVAVVALSGGLAIVLTGGDDRAEVTTADEPESGGTNRSTIELSNCPAELERRLRGVGATASDLQRQTDSAAATGSIALVTREDDIDVSGGLSDAYLRSDGARVGGNGIGYTSAARRLLLEVGREVKVPIAIDVTGVDDGTYDVTAVLSFVAQDGADLVSPCVATITVPSVTLR